MKKLFTLFCLLTMVLMAKAQDDYVFTVGDVSLTPGGDPATLTITSNKSIASFCGFQFDLMVPEGVSVVGEFNDDEAAIGYYDEEEEFVETVTSGATKSAHTIQFIKIEGGYRFIVFSLTNAKFKTNTTIMSIQLVAASDAVPGKYSIFLDESTSSSDVSKVLKLATVDSAVKPGAVAGNLTIAGNAETTIEYELKSDYGTLILPFAAELPEGLKAYSCAEVEGNVLTLEEAESLAANTPYIMGGAKGSYAFTGTPVPSDVALTAGLLTGVLEDTKAPEGSYVLQNNTAGLGFYKVGSVIPTVKAYRCYLAYEGEALALMYRFGGTTNISNIEAEGNNAMYDILGRKVEGPAPKGAYIQNGKKVFVK